MILEHLELTNYRNYRSLSLDLAPGINVVCGDNAQGKTNLLEAVYFLGTLRSFRVRSEAELVNWGQMCAGIKADFIRSDGQGRTLEVRWAKNEQGRWERRTKRNQVILKSYGDFLSEVPLTLFIPQDLSLIQGGPDMRRRYLDVLLCKTSSSYFRSLLRYQQVLKQRNEWLKTRGRNWKELEIWDEQMVDLAAVIVEHRRRALDELNAITGRIFAGLSPQPLKMELSYASSLSGSRSDMLALLSRRRELEIQRKCTLEGPQRDDMLLTVEGKSFKLCASQGQSRSAALALRLAEALYLGQVCRNSAIVLLDDCFSELDKGRCQRLFDYLGGVGQVIITAVDRLSYAGSAAVSEFLVDEGQIAPLDALA